MIVTFKHKALRALFEKGDASQLNQNHVRRLRIVLARLHTARCISDIKFPGSELHPLTGELKGYWSLKVNSNWRIMFRMMQDEVYDVDYIDYH